jgi:hypothetical protein
MRWRLALTGGSLLAISAAALWLDGPQQRPSGIATLTSCRLPVYLAQSKRGGFLSVPGYTFTEVPKNTFEGSAKAASGYWAYNASTARWLPVDYRMISPDGKWWVYATPLGPPISATAAVHLVDGHGTERTVWTGTGRAFLLGWTTGGAVFGYLGPAPQYEVGYRLIDPVTGKLRSLATPPGEPVGVDSAGLWSTGDLAGIEPNKAPQATLLRTSISSGATMTWLDQVGLAIILVFGFDQDNRPILGLHSVNSPERYVLLTSPNTETDFTTDAQASGFSPATALADSQGVWFGDTHGGVWRWTAGLGLQLLAELDTPPTDRGFDVAAIAGPCR